ncbi:MAG TPA: NfeD family protein, partial [Spirochaetales bacterium]|nr:NfeD family protein [Spirochaetales bacterium]
PARRPKEGEVTLRAWAEGLPESQRFAQINISTQELTVRTLHVRPSAFKTGPEQGVRLQGDIGLSAGLLHNLRAFVGPLIALEVGLDYPLLAGRLGVRVFGGFSRGSQSISGKNGLPDARSTVILVPVGGALVYKLSRVTLSPYVLVGALAQIVRTSNTADYVGERLRYDVTPGVVALLGIEPHLGPGRIFLQAGYLWSKIDNADVELLELSVDGETRLATAEEAASLEKSRPGQVERVRTVSAKGKLLSLTAGEAERYGLSEGTVADLDALASLLGSPGPAVEVSPSGADQVVVFITSGGVQALLILIGLVALFLEINSPGFGLPGTVAIIAFFTLFGTNALMGSVGSLEIILFILGIGLLAVEIFILPGFGVAGISGIVLIGAALVFSMQDFVIPTVSWEWDLLGRNVMTVVAGLLAGIAGIGVLALAGPRIKLFDRLMLKTTIEGTAGGALGADAEAPAPPASPLEGRRGVARTVLRPSGRAEIDGVAYSVETEGLFLPEGTPVRVLKVRGSRIVVGPDAGNSDIEG